MTAIKHILALALLCFFLNSFLNAQTLADTLETKVNGAIREGRIVDQLSNQFNQFPSGEFLIAPQNKNLNYGIIIYNIDILPDRAIFSAAMAFRDPKSNQLIVFKADNIYFSNTHGLTGPVKLYLLSDVQLNFGNCADITLYAGPQNTYAIFECKGLKEFAIEGKVQFNSALLLPVDKDGAVVKNKKLTADFALIAKYWSDMVVQISLQPFQIKGLTNFVFNITEATMDLSETSNTNSMLFPNEYANEPGNLQLWEGFYLRKGSVTLPAHFKTKTQKRTEIGVENLLIDEWGFSGTLFGKNLLRFDEGQISEWPFSINSLEIVIVMNEIKRGEIAGEIGLPILPDTSRLGYKGYISVNDNYGLQVSVNKNLCIPAFKISTLTLTPNSYIDVNIINGNIQLEANLNGQMAIENKADEKATNPQFKFPAIEFQGLRVANTEPRFNIDYLGLKNTNVSNDKMGQYPLCIERIGLYNNGADKTLQLKFAMNLMSNISVKTGLAIHANYANDRLQLKGISLESIDINSSISCFALRGQIQFIKADKYFGNGLNGQIQFKMNQPKLEAAASIMFGNVNEHRYWYFDANMVWEDAGLPFFPGAEINGFLGGAWHGMRELTATDPVPTGELGLTASGKQYIPDAKAGLGLRAGIYIRSTGGSANSKPFIAKTALEIQFNRNMGINELAFFGNADFMTKNTDLNKSDLKQNTSSLPSKNNWKGYLANYQPKGNISSPFSLNFDFARQVYQANFAVYIQGVAGDKIAGSGVRGLAGEVAAYFSKSKWYVLIGTPQQPIGIKMKLSGSNSAAINAYFMAGKDIPPAAPLPNEITSILGYQNADAMRSLADLNSGNAFAFGSRIMLNVGSEGGEKNISIYASLKAILGFDMNVRPTDNTVYCASNNEQPGINGWFANGQLFAFLQGRVGASVQTKAVKAQYDLLTLTAAAQLYCEGPKPFYSNGSASVKVNIAGIINKQMKLNFEIGEPCDIRQSKLSDTSIILATNPENNAINFNVAKNISTQFSVPINSTFKDLEGRDITFTLKQYELSDNGQLIGGQLKFNASKTALVFEPNNLLPGQKKLKIKIVVQAQFIESNYEVRNANNSKINILLKEQNLLSRTIENMKANQVKECDFGNGRKVMRIDRFQPYKLNGNEITETKEIYFTTGPVPQTISEENLAFAYPVKNQMNYHPTISSVGYLQLIKGQANLTNLVNKKVVVLLAENNGKIIGETNAKIINKRIEYWLPNSILKNNTIYQLIFKIKLANASSEIGNTLSNTNNTNLYTTINQGLNTSTQSAETILLSYYFGTSNFSSLSQKMQNNTISQSTFSNGTYNIQIKNKEYFDSYEFGLKQPLMILINSPIKTSWMGIESKKIYSIYQFADPLLFASIDLNRDTSEYGLVPRKAVRIIQKGIDNIQLMKQGISGYKKPLFTNESIEIENFSMDIMTRDLEAIKTALIQYVNAGNVNATALNTYLALFKGSSTQAGLATFNMAKSNTMAASTSITSITNKNFNAINIGNSKTTNLGNLAITNNLNQQKSAWLLQISQLQITSYTNQNFIYQINYHLPDAIAPIYTYQFNIK